MIRLLAIFLVVMASPLVNGLENGLARTPPMGWLTWQRFRCVTDCKLYPKECISENLITRTADLLKEKGYLDAGYEYVGIDDCWPELQRDSSGNLVPDKERFPNGMKYISKYLHERGLKFGIYQDYGTQTCAKYPGSYGFEQKDISLFVDWEVDYIKLDGCNINIRDMDAGYPDFGKKLNASGRPILYSCSWPAYQEDANYTPDYRAIAKSCNIWRNYDDIEDSYESVSDIMDWFAENQDRFAAYAAPGSFNDPDMLVIGNFGLTEAQSQVQMAVWAILAAPLLISADLETIKPEFEKILLNKKVIAVNQDQLGKQGLRVFHTKQYDIWSRDLHDGSKALAFVSRRIDGVGYYKSFSYQDMKLDKDIQYIAEDLFNEEEEHKTLKYDDLFTVKINPTGVKFYKFIPIDKQSGSSTQGVQRNEFSRFRRMNQNQGPIVNNV